MDKILKFLLKLSAKERTMILPILEDIKANSLENYDLKKLTNQPDLRRIRKGNIRIIFRTTATGNTIINIDWRGNV